MVRFLKTKTLYYSDVNLIAQKGVVARRRDVPQEKHRIIVSPMAAIVGEKFCVEAAKLGVTVCLHRFCDIEEQVALFNKTKYISEKLFCAIGLKDAERMEALLQAGCTRFLLDVANGHSSSVVDYMATLSCERRIKDLMCGNVHTSSGFTLLDQSMSGRKELGEYVRVGIGNGAACLTTREATGFGRGQISELLECFEHKADVKSPCCIVADGGIRTPADAAKAFAAGADYVMMGSYFSSAIEAETNVGGDGTYWGGASYKQQEMFTSSNSAACHAEGTVLPAQKNLVPLSNLVDNLWSSLASAVSYSGKDSLTNFIGAGVFEIKYNAGPF